MERRKPSRLTLFALVFALLVLTIAPASAVTNGELDEENHPYVVLVVLDVPTAPSGGFRCSGTLLSPTVVLTAGHCTNNFPDGPITGMRIFPESNVDANLVNYPLAGSNSIEAVSWAAHPLYETAPFFVHDVGVVILDAPGYTPPGGVFGTLPSLDSLDSLDSLKKRKTTTFTSVGYGLQAAQLNNPTPQSHTQGDKIRMVAYPHLIQINSPGFTGDFSLLLSNNTRTGGTCFGDSGGPNFLGDTNIVAGVTSFGLNPNCGGTGGVFRMDRENVLDFVNSYLP